MAKDVDPDAYFAGKGVRFRIGPDDVVTVARGSRAGEIGTVTHAPDDRGRMGLRFKGGERPESWGVSEVDLAGVTRRDELEIDGPFARYHADVLAVLAMRKERGVSFDAGAKAAYGTYHDTIGSAPSGTDACAWMEENYPEISLRVARIERESASYAAAREVAMNDVAASLRLALHALGKHAAREFVDRLDAPPRALPSVAFVDAARDAIELRATALDGVRSSFEAEGPFMSGFGAEVARLRGWPRGAAKSVMNAIMQPVHLVLRLPEEVRVDILDVRALGDGRYAMEVRSPHVYALPDACERVGGLLASPGIVVESAVVRDPNLSRPGLDYGAAPDSLALHGMEREHLLDEIRWLEQRVASGDTAMAAALGTASDIARDEARLPVP